MQDLELIKSKLDIVDVIGSYLPDVKGAGSNFKARCPFHNEKTASLMINPSLQIFKCFGCGKGGDVIKFIQEMERVEFPEAIKIAAEKAGIELEQGDFKKDKKLEDEKKRIIEANTLAAKFYNYILKSHKSGEIGRKYAQKRKIDAARIDKFMIGYATNARTNLKKFLMSRGFKEAELVKWGLLVEREKITIDKFRNRLLQPIFNLRGEVVGFSGRYIGQSKNAPKYLNSPETLVYKKNEILYGLYHAKDAIRREKFVILEEGNIDILSSHRVGIENIVAPLGTAFTPNQAKLIKRHTDEVYFCFDTDDAGTKAIIRGLSILEDFGIKHRVIDLTGYQDPDDLICKDPDQWPIRIKQNRNTIEYLMEKLSVDLDLDRVEGKTKFHARILPVLKSIKDEVVLNHFAKEISIILDISEDAILAKVKSTKAENHSYKNVQISIEDIQANAKVTSKARMKASPSRKLELYFLALLVQTDNLFKLDLEEEYFQDDLCRMLYLKLKEAGEDMDFGKVADGLDDDGRTILENIILQDISAIKYLDKELADMSKRLREAFLRRQILHMRKSLMQNPNNDEIVKKLGQLTEEFKKILQK